jgi:uncharacterized membrane protein SpoIIM required for sporulation
VENKSKYFSQPFTAAFLISAVVILLTLLVSSFIGFDAPPDVADQIANEVENEAATTNWLDIFINNFGLTLLTFVPFFGFPFEIYIQFNTGYGFGALAQFYEINNVQAVLVTLATPVGLLENTAYIFALTESVILAYSIYRREFKKRFVNHAWKTLLFVALLLFMGAIVEAALIGRL